MWALSVCRTCRMNSIISETQQCTWGSVDDADYISSQIRQRDDIIRHLKARLQRFEVHLIMIFLGNDSHFAMSFIRRMNKEQQHWQPVCLKSHMFYPFV
jgi:hypothetical protein